MISPVNNFAFVHVNKTAGRSIIRALSRFPLSQRLKVVFSGHLSLKELFDPQGNVDVAEITPVHNKINGWYVKDLEKRELTKKVIHLYSNEDKLEKLKGLGGAGLEGLRNMATGIADAVTGDAISGIQTLGFGTSKNPMMAQIFKDVPFREFNFDYEFIPRNEKEKDDVYKIINLFKFHMLPEMTTEFRFLVPSQFQVQYMYRSKENSYIPKISRCILTGASFDYAPEQQLQSFKADAQGAPMAHIKMTLTFAETEIMTKETIAKGF